MSRRYDPFSKEVKHELARRYGKRCCLCGHRYPMSKLTIHHIKKYCNGGETSAENCGLLCEKCHVKLHKSEKHNKKYYKYLNEMIKNFKKRREINTKRG